jgi:hypothetical protein
MSDERSERQALLQELCNATRHDGVAVANYAADAIIALRAEVERLKRECDDWGEREALCCPEGVTFTEQIQLLWRKLAEAEMETPLSVSPVQMRDADWILAIGSALSDVFGRGSGFRGPIVPKVDALRKLFAAIREKDAPLRFEVYCKRCGKVKARFAFGDRLEDEDCGAGPYVLRDRESGEETDHD